MSESAVTGTSTATRQTATSGEKPIVHRGIVVTHGVGSQRRVDQLDDVVEPLVEFLGRTWGYDHVHVKARTHISDDLTASATIHLFPRDEGEVEEVWYVREAWWAETFRPSSSATVLGWAVRAAAFHVQSTWRNVFVRNVGRVANNGPKDQLPGVWKVVSASKPRAFFDALIWVVMTLGYLAIYLISAVIILPLYVFLLLPFWLLFPAGVGQVQRGLVNMLTGGIGDQHATTNRHVAVAGAADAVVNALWYFLGPKRPESRVYDTVTLIAHSGGCVVSYDALTRDDVQQWLREGKRRLTWITAGSGLNLAYRMRARGKKRDQVFWGRCLRETVNWIDIYSRYDPVPQGEPPAEMVAALMGPEAGRPFVSLRVVNHDWPLSDHGGYWDNREEAMSRIVHAIIDSRLGMEALDRRDGSPAETIAADGGRGEHPLAAAVGEAMSETSAGARRDAVTRSRVLSLAAFFAGVWVVVRWGPGIGAWALGDRTTPYVGNVLVELRQAIGEHVPHWIGPIEIGQYRFQIAGIVVVAAIAYTLLLVKQLAGHWRSWARSDEV